MNIQSLMSYGVRELRDVSSTPQLDTELLLSYATKQTREYLFQNPEKNVEKKTKDMFKKYVERRKKKTPIPHITHNQDFFGIRLYVNEHVLIPRPETEELVEDVVRTFEENKNIKLILDVGTGSGCIAIALVKSIPKIKVLGLEISKKALEIAKKNTKNHKLDKRIKLIQSDLLSRLPKKEVGTPKIIVANLPYIGTKTNNFIAEDVKLHEPKEALFGGEDGLDHYRNLLKQIAKKNISFKAMFFEIGFSQTEAIEKEIRKFLPKSKIKILKDLAGFPRTVKITP